MYKQTFAEVNAIISHSKKVHSIREKLCKSNFVYPKTFFTVCQLYFIVMIQLASESHPALNNFYSLSDCKEKFEAVSVNVDNEIDILIPEKSKFILDHNDFFVSFQKCVVNLNINVTRPNRNSVAYEKISAVNMSIK